MHILALSLRCLLILKVKCNIISYGGKVYIKVIEPEEIYNFLVDEIFI